MCFKPTDSIQSVLGHYHPFAMLMLFHSVNFLGQLKPFVYIYSCQTFNGILTSCVPPYRTQLLTSGATTIGPNNESMSSIVFDKTRDPERQKLRNLQGTR